MKKNLLFFLIFCSSFLQAQNLVPNPSFELYSTCPTSTNELYKCVLWSSYGNSPDYFNACVPSLINVPNSEFGFQYAHGGVAMIGLGTYRWPGSPNGPNCREYAGVQLINPLLIGQKYFTSFFTNFAYGPSVAVASNKIGCRFSNQLYSEFNSAPINNIADLFTDSIITDSATWYKISGSFIADSTYSFLIIGNFFQDSLTDTLHVPSTAYPDYTYYYIDDVCVSTDSLYNENWTGITKSYEKGNLKIFPNPVSDYLNIENTENSEIDIKLFDAIGKIILNFKKSSTDNKVIIKLSSIANGYYIISIQNKNKIFNSTLIINH